MSVTWLFHPCEKSKSSLWTLCGPHWDPKDLSLVQGGVIGTDLSRKEDANRPTYTLQPGFSPCH